MMNGSFYEKIINVHFFNKVDQIEPTQSLICSPSGYKPKISLSGSLLANSLYTHLELRITNASISFDATSYRKISIDAGYAGPVSDPTKFMSTGITGTITQAYIESPGPDGVTVFIILIGEQSVYSQRYSTGKEDDNVFSMPWGSTYKEIIKAFTSSCLTKIKGFSIREVIMPTKLETLMYGNKTEKGPDFQIYGTVGGILDEMLSTRFGLLFFIKNNSISVFNKENSASLKPIEIDRFSSTPSIRVADHINFQSPWTPNLFPGDLISVAPEFMKMTFGGWQTSDNVQKNHLFNILKIDFDFSTVDNTNVMIVDSLSTKGGV